tara:strand:- start:4652 stop:4948 length:297 start_codon:yes stop_codon:yes gene_type:complete
MLTIFVCGAYIIYMYYRLNAAINELKYHFDKLACLKDISKMQEDIISLKQGLINLNAKINNNEKWAVRTTSDLNMITKKLVEYVNPDDIAKALRENNA